VEGRVYSVGNREIDDQHRSVFETLNSLHAAVLRGEGKSFLDGRMRDLVDFTHVHLAAEERFMDKVRYPDLAAHKAEHDILLAEVDKLYTDWQADRPVTLTVLTFIAEWLDTHVLNTDMAYARFVQAQNVGAPASEPATAFG
jgi:hemerythrin